MKLLRKPLVDSFTLFKKKWKLSGIASLLDAAFVVLFVRLQVEMILLMRNHLLTTSSAVERVSNQLTQMQMVRFDHFLAQDTAFIAAYTELVKIVAWYALGILACWLVVKGLSWAVTHKIAGKPFFKAWLNFGIVSIIGAVLAVGLFLLLIKGLSSSIFLPLSLGQGSVTTLIAIAAALVLYIVTVTFSTTGKNAVLRGVKQSFTRCKTLFPAWLLTIAGIVVLVFIAQFFWKISIALGVLVSLFLFPYLVYSRLFMIEVANER